jgi:hypothetical protein
MRIVLSLVIRAFLAFLGASFALASLPRHAEELQGLLMLGLAGLPLGSRT